MATPTDARPEVRRVPMSWDEFLAWEMHVGDEWSRVEYYDGELVLSAGDRQHALACKRITNAVDAVVPDEYEATSGWAWRGTSVQREFEPDIMVYRKPDGNPVRLLEAPVLAVEVTSSNRKDDLVTKLRYYAEVGIRHYWILDRRTETLLVYELADAAYLLVQVVSKNEPAEVRFGIASVSVDLGRLLAL